MDASIFKSQEIHEFILRSLQEDIGNGDHSSLAAIPAGTKGKAQMIIKEEGVLAGVELAETVFHISDPELNVQTLLKDGEAVQYGQIALTVEGSVHSILRTERLVLNLIQRLSGIATRTHQMNQLIAGTSCRLLDTRKTTPGLRLLEKWAVKTGGGENHRIGLYDMVMLKDNHNDYAGGITKAVANTVAYLKENKLDLKIEVETRNIKEVKEALATGHVDRIMLDNFSPEAMKEAVALIGGRVETEASGGITEANIRAYAETGVDFISVGALTHSVKSLDISLKEVKA
ncbi:MAG: carboxylating nicotinate-nucleotide diphosphorylase [Bacteroidota bacterium]|nr:carboxylating nicotinate-nucleotide diphosphorylase [Bacteroidota bacterium]MDX5430405.1 carboxylating nicotinate-nucleotide diphosphorylase [Bacteroidota bacterium]MDX5469164.1 carboxylating nicotinate-nucleotide diphosphorylase [Bacteroidota bacterium]